MEYKEKVQLKLDEIDKKLQENKDIILLSIESSCDETSVAILKNGREILANVISSQIEIHKRFGGVVPEVASRNHVVAINNVLADALEKANETLRQQDVEKNGKALNEVKDKTYLTLNDLDAICVTYGAGLVGALMVGVNFAKTLAYSLGLPIVAVNHIKGHIAANYISHENLKPPFICLVVSGGHTAILRIDDYLDHTLIGETLDDAIGEAFDKVARVVGLGYPGGPKIDKLAKVGENNIEFVHKSHLDNTYNISYSGLKTAVINYMNKLHQQGLDAKVEDVCASFEHQAVDMLVEKTVRAAKELNFKQIAMAGGVAANSYLRDKLTLEANKENIEVFYPPMALCTDNAAMIGCCGYYDLINHYSIADLSLSPDPSLKLSKGK
ncbi:MAG: tRNA (adenosine(37)-N6)-threonylcarbamoyltransferase complex transferase subunit TsaD [Clostridiales bacterium]|nr:tRNA (adenosine(37)-N6)-threonylcarbamoyltransferase complex transferase subunit TsaD [Candidatus Apopatousia equi]